MMRTYFLIACLLYCYVSQSASAQTLPYTSETFFQRFVISDQLPARILNGRTILFYDVSLSLQELERIQASFSATGIDAVLAIELQKILAGHDVRKVIFDAIQKREISNLVFLDKHQEGYRCTITHFNQKPSFTSNRQRAYQLVKPGLGDLLVQLNRDLLNNYAKQNLLINDQPETDLTLRLVQGSRIESMSSDLRIDKLAVRLSDNENGNAALKLALSDYPFSLAFVGDSLSDAELRQQGFWYVLQCVHLPEKEAMSMLGYATGVKPSVLNEPSLSSREVYKFYFKRLEFNNLYLGKQWDAATQWETALKNLLDNLRKELNIK